MKTRMRRQSPDAPTMKGAAAIAASSLLAFALAYAALCLVALYRPDWLAHGSVFAASLVGPPGWLALGPGARPMFYGSTFAFLAMALVGASVRPLLLPCALLGFLIWLGSGFMAVSMSI